MWIYKPPEGGNVDHEHLSCQMERVCGFLLILQGPVEAEYCAKVVLLQYDSCFPKKFSVIENHVKSQLCQCGKEDWTLGSFRLAITNLIFPLEFQK